MEPIGAIGIALTGIGIAERISKYLLPPKTAKPHIAMEYIGGEILKYSAVFELPKVKRSFLRRRKAFNPVLQSLLGFMTADLAIEGDPLAESVSLDRLLDWPGLLRDEALNLKVGDRVELQVSIPMDLNSHILHSRPAVDSQALASLNNHKVDVVTIPVRNNLSIPVSQYPITVPMPSRKLNRVRIRKGQTGKEYEEEQKITLTFSARVFSTHGGLNKEFPNIDTSRTDDWIRGVPGTEANIVIPVDIPKKERVLIVLYFEKGV